MKFTFEFESSPKEYIRQFTNKVDDKIKEFYKHEFNTPEVLYVNWYTYKKLELACLKCDTSEFGLEPYYMRNNDKPSILGLEIRCLPFQENDFMELAYLDEESNIGLGMYTKSLEVLNVR